MYKPLRYGAFLVYFFIRYCLVVNAQFLDYSAQAGITVSHEIAMWGCGMSAFDFNADGFDDLTIGENQSGVALYRSLGNGSFTLDSYIPLTAAIKQITWVDFDNDHDADLFVTTNGAGFFLYERTDDGSLALSADLFSQYTQYDAQGASWGDYDQDGWKDLFVCHYLYGQAPGNPNLLFHNEQGILVEVGEQLGVASWVNQAFQSVWTDFDNDGWKDLYVINDHDVGNEYYHNNSGSGFSNLSMENGAGIALSSMSNSVADYDRDGDFDIFVSNGGIQALLENQNGIFTNEAAELGFDFMTFGWSGLWLDHDGDGWQDLYLCNTEAYVPGNHNYFLVNEEGEAFEELLFDWTEEASFVAVSGDFNNDRWVDFAVYNGYPASVHIWLNDAQSAHHSVKINLQGQVSDYIGVGAEVRAFVQGRASAHQVMAGENYLSQNSSSIMLGCGDATYIDSLVVSWPSGWKDVYYNLPTDSQYVFSEGETFQASLFSEDDFRLCPGQMCDVALTLSNQAFQGTVVWSNGAGGFINQLPDTGNHSVTITHQTGLTRTLYFYIQQHTPAVYQTVVSAPLCNAESTGSCIVTSEDIVWLEGDAFQSSASFELLTWGNHQFDAVDRNGCESILSFTIPETPAITLSQLSYDLCASASEWPALEVQGAALPYTLVPANFDEPVEAGEHAVEVVDANGCSASFIITIEHLPSPSVWVHADTACAGGFASWNWQVTNDVVVVWAEIENTGQQELPAGDYALHVTDEFGCSSYYDFTVEEYPPLLVDFVLQQLEGEAQLSANVSGGMSPYTLQWSSGENTPFIVASAAGAYSILVEDAAACSVSADTTLTLSSMDAAVASWLVYPVPCDDVLKLETMQDGPVFIFDIHNRLIGSAHMYPGTNVLDTTGWPAGRYVVRFNKHSVGVQRR